MAEMTLDDVAKLCRRTDKLIKEATRVAVEFVKQNEDLKAKYLQIFHQDKDLDYSQMMANSFAFSAVFTKEEYYKTLLDNEAVQKMVELWNGNKPRWINFSVDRHLGDNAFVIRDESKYDLMNFYSLLLEYSYRRSELNDCSYVALIIFNGFVWQPVESVHYYQSFGSTDIDNWCKIIDPMEMFENSFSYMVENYFIDFFKIDKYYKNIPTYYDGELVKHYWSDIYVPDYHENPLIGSWKTKMLDSGILEMVFNGISDKEINKCRLKKEYYQAFGKTKDSFWAVDPNLEEKIYYDKKNKSIYLYAKTLSSYEKLSHIAIASFLDPDGDKDLPDWSISPEIVELAKSIEEPYIPWEVILGKSNNE